jgi:plasmid stabilization system protein ParE
MPTTFGELTQLAQAHLDAAARHDLRATTPEQQLAVAAALDRCLRATGALLAAPPRRARVRPDPAVERAAQALREHLKYGRQLMHTALPSVRDEEPAERAARAHPAAAHLVTAAVTIGASRDLLETHTMSTAAGRQDRSDLAALIDTPDARRELTVTAAAHADRLASLTAALAVRMRATSPDAKAGLVLNAAETLAAAGNTAAHLARARHIAGVLGDVPALGPLRRQPVQPGEPFLTLLDQAVAGAKRLHVAAFREVTAGRSERHTPAALAAVSVAMAISHLATCRILDGITAGDDQARVDSGAARTAFEAWSRARERWLGLRAAWGPRDGQALRAEAIDLATRLGRLTYADPAWTPRPGASHALRPLGHLADDPEQSATLLEGLQRLAAISSRIAAEHARLIDIQVTRGQLLVPTRTIPWQQDAHQAWVPAPPQATFALRRAYEEAETAAVDSHRTLAELAHATRDERAEHAHGMPREMVDSAPVQGARAPNTFVRAHEAAGRDGGSAIEL